MAYIDAIPPKSRLICSFWGSDLLRTSGPETFVQVHRGLRRADAITTQSPELREIILSTYGRDLAPRVHCCRFPANPSLFLEIEALTQSSDARLAARRHLDLPGDAQIVVVGHNGSPANRQPDAIRGIAQAPPVTRQKYHLVFPFTYAGNAAGATSIREVCSHFGFAHSIIEGRLDTRSLAALRVAADVFLQVPESDALSNTVLEYLFAGAKVVSGAWLPYGPFRRAGLPLVEVDSYSALHTVLADLDGAIPMGHDELTTLQGLIRGRFFANAVMPDWIDVYRRALTGNGRHA